MKELLLGPFLGAKHLDVVHQQRIYRSITLLERTHAVIAQRVDHLVHKLLTGDVDDLDITIVSLEFAADGLHQVSFAHSHPPVQVEGVIHPGGIGGHGSRGGVGELIAASHHKTLKRILGIEDSQSGIEVELDLNRWRPNGHTRKRLHLFSDENHRLEVHGQMPGRIQDLADILVLQPSSRRLVGHRDEEGLPLDVAEPGGLQPVAIALRAHPVL